MAKLSPVYHAPSEEGELLGAKSQLPEAKRAGVQRRGARGVEAKGAIAMDASLQSNIFF